MKLGIMQPYFFPYIGYWQLINAVDVFVIYDNIEYTKKGWINRNRYLKNGEAAYFTLPLKKDSDYLNVNERYLSQDFDKIKLLNQIKSAYFHAPYFEKVYELFAKIIMQQETNLFEYIYHSVMLLLEKLEIETQIKVSSALNAGHTLKGKEKVIALCKSLNADTYINPIGGKELYSKEEFLENEVKLLFIRPKNFRYQQFNNDYVSRLSILDVMMFNSHERIKNLLNLYILE